MSLLIRCDFCGKDLAQDYKRPGVVVRDERGFVAVEYDACDEDTSLIVMLLQERVGSRSPRRRFGIELTEIES